MFARGRRD